MDIAYSSDLLKRLGILNPIIQAPMAGAGTPELAIATSLSGGLGSLGVALMSPDEIQEAIRRVRGATDRPFNINLLVFSPPTVNAVRIEQMRGHLRPHFEKLGIDPDSIPALTQPPFGLDDQLRVVLEERVPVLSFAFGVLDPAAITDLKAGGTFVMGTATSVIEARILADAGVDAVVAQGMEAGGHRATFAHGFGEGMALLSSLVGKTVRAIDIPVIASGGLSDGIQVARILNLGASAVQIGTRFLACDENSIPPVYRSAVLKGGETVITSAYTGRPARALRSAFTDEFASASEIPDFPIQALLTAPLRNAAAQRGDEFPEYLPMLAGTGVGHGGAGSTANVVGSLIERL